jgi:hypothetical protein
MSIALKFGTSVQKQLVNRLKREIVKASKLGKD